MEIQIVLDQEEVRDAVAFYLKNKYGVVQSKSGVIRYLASNEKMDKSIVCRGILEIKKQIDLTF